MFNKNKKKEILDENLSTVSNKNDLQAKKDADYDLKTFYKSIQEFEENKFLLLKSSEKKAWKIAYSAVALAVLLGVALAGLTPFKKVIPFTITVDKNTGFTEVSEPVKGDKVSYGESVDKFFMSRFVINRESYDWQTIQDMYDSVKLLSTDEVFSEYRTEITNKTASPVYLLGENKKIAVKIIGATFIGKLGQIRFVKIVKNKDGSIAPEYTPRTWLATIAYDYKKEIKTDKDRTEVNPFGFEVVSYRVDPENVEVQK